VRVDAVRQRIGEIRKRPFADAVLRVRRDVGRDERAECRLEFNAAAEPELRLALRIGRRVTGRTSRRPEDLLAGLDIAGAGGGKRLGLDLFGAVTNQPKAPAAAITTATVIPALVQTDIEDCFIA
jgi:hypothetical protein